MALKRVSKITYVTDRGIEMDVKEMETTHLVNAICHHTKQRDVLKEYTQNVTDTHLARRVDLLNETINTLLDELETRDPALDHEDEPRRSNHYDTPYG